MIKFFISCDISIDLSSKVIVTDTFSFLIDDTYLPQSHLYQGRTSGGAYFLLACIHPVTSCRADWIFHPYTS